VRPLSRTELIWRLLGTAFILLFAVAMFVGLPRAWSIAGIVLWLGCLEAGAKARKRARARRV
jgi:hypothetical protein